MVCVPLLLRQFAERAEHRGEFDWSANLTRLAYLLHPSSELHFLSNFRVLLADHGPGDRDEAIARLVATGSASQVALARLMQAQESCDWARVIEHSRAIDIDFIIAKTAELRALGELGHINEMLRAILAVRQPFFQMPDAWVLFVAAFTGQVECAERLLTNSALPGLDEDAKAYWLAVARHRRNYSDASALAKLRVLSENAARSRMRRSAAGYLERASTGNFFQERLSEELDAAFARITKDPGVDFKERWATYRERVRTRKPAAIRAAILVIVLGILADTLVKWLG
jgi:hypothetical protein